MSRAARGAVCWLAAGLACGALLGLATRGAGGRDRAQSGACLPPLQPARAGDSAAPLLLVGVMSAAQYLDTRARAAADTWGAPGELPGALAVYSSEAAAHAPGATSLPLVALAGVTDEYPPQRKSLLMLLHMFEHHGDTFEWFLRADDDVYVRGDRLARLLRSLDSRRALFLGQAGRGAGPERGALALRRGENFCMGGPGVLLSRETLRRVAPHIRRCLRTLLTPHEDVELGRCVARYAGVSCTWSYDMQTILHHNSSGAAAYSGRLKRREVEQAITLHPVKLPPHMYRLHAHCLGGQAADVRADMLELYRELHAARAGLPPRAPFPPGPDRLLRDAPVLGAPLSPARYRPPELRLAVPHEFISRSLYSATHPNPRRRLESPRREALDDAVRDLMTQMNLASRARGRLLDFTELLYGYERLDPLHGVDLALDVLLRYRRYRGRKLTAAVRRHAYLQRDLGPLELREVTVIHTAVPRVTVLVPLQGRHATFARFMQDYELTVLAPREPAALLLVLYEDPPEDAPTPSSRELSAALLRQYADRYPRATLRLVAPPGPPGTPFSRGAALTAAAALCDDDELLLFMDVDMTFTRAALRRVRKHARHGESAYFPVVFSEYDPAVVRGTDYTRFAGETAPPPPRVSGSAPDTVHPEEGYFRQYGFGIAALYAGDLRRAGGFDLSLHGWGLEDVRLYETLTRAPWLRVVRAPEPGMRHIFHAVHCEPDLPRDRLLMCLGTRASTLASDRQLAHYFLNHPHLMWPAPSSPGPPPPPSAA